MIIALFPKVHEKEAKKLAEEALAFLTKKGCQVVVEDDKAEALRTDPLSSVDPQSIEVLMTMGGDGSILRVAHQYSHLSGAILGINLGHLGFMADVPIPDMLSSLEDLVSGAYTIEERLMFEGKSSGGQTFFAMNDCVLHRARTPHLVEVSIHVDGLFLNTFQADGVIIATPNGSTAYSLAAGGPIISPTIDACVLTPICPHTISNRPIVFTPKENIEITYHGHTSLIEFVADGLHHFELKPGDTITLTKSTRTFKLVSLNRTDYFSTLRHKLGWSGKLR
ncbi:NAD(+)/NADH kinase [Candidatus Neptunochlamydia vexilliferae]|uniref:NAD kinase n=1 Tax=Candidatus Neptunichlamydia vexilliferae TaxID=1651774 RepID=A0ABS0AZ36_9BACT|nr:NAD(+)/NADH kinase [Candidatus Neptunochlamydia vexilliferae]MBF5059235.1 NAD kinase [Candidatus Neptunochlamydia vexilliferae]